ncbi:MAG: hypothetical protein V1738_00045 [Patescibacteria group bacterium]
MKHRRQPIIIDMRQDRGAILLFALLIMSSVIIGSIGLGTIILEMLQQTRISDDSVLAYYAAETGIEEAIYNVRQTGNLPPNIDEASPESLDNNADWWGTITGSTEIIYAEVDRFGFIEVSLYDPEAPAVATSIDHVVVSWSNPTSVLQASVVSWLPGGQVVWSDDVARFENPFEFVGGSATLSLGPAIKLHKLRLRAKDDALQDVTVRAYDAGGNPQSVPGQVRIDMTGDFSQSRRRLVATMPRGAPLSGIFDYVMFSECSLVKGRPISCP